MQTSDAVRVGPAIGYFVSHTIMGWPWGTLASMAAFLYSAVMLGEWAWKKVKAWRFARKVRLDDEARKRTRRVVAKLDAKRDGAAE